MTTTAVGALLACAGAVALLRARRWRFRQLGVLAASSGTALCAMAGEGSRAAWVALSVACALAGVASALNGTVLVRRSARTALGVIAMAVIVASLLSQESLGADRGPRLATTAAVASEEMAAPGTVPAAGDNVQNGMSPVRSPANPEAVGSDEIMSACPAEANDQRLCLLSYFEDLAAKEGAEVAVKLAASEQKAYPEGPVALHCHEVTHTMGPAALAEAGGDVALALTYDDGYDYACSGGYVHGVFTWHFRELGYDRLSTETATLCADLVEEGTMDSDNCYHILGHELTLGAASRADVPDALQACALIPADVFGGQHACFNGGWMEYFGDRDHLAAIDANPRIEDATTPCGSLADDDTPNKRECYREAAPQVLKSAANDPEAALRACRAQAPGEYVEMCDFGVGKAVSVFAAARPANVVTTCSAVSEDLRDSCLLYAAMSIAHSLGEVRGTEVICAEMTPGRRAECEERVLDSAHTSNPVT